jgi:hypothetical protein
MGIKCERLRRSEGEELQVVNNIVPDEIDTLFAEPGAVG